ncbi:peroxiredoxin [Kangiella sp. HZ709]|uniref:peroxiredoxin family protein n=1 Tax=Kangiella sp. HZ709 TaxID=2666328 RepID=UPI0012B000B3|nr:redoxin domain-containing protein [Kangiella sp. HZ709]MRX27581.1 redoxin domain-containing protein [Kangiella sp. HZ709]
MTTDIKKSQKPKKTWWRHALEILTLVSIFFAVMLWQERHLLSNDGHQKAPEQVLVGLDENTHALPINNQKQLLYFFAPWCTVCDISIGNIELQKSALLNKGYQVRYIALDWKSQQEVQAFVDENDLTFPVLMGTKETMQQYSIKGFPTYYLIDDNGVITAGSQGYSTSLGVWIRSLGQ